MNPPRTIAGIAVVISLAWNINSCNSTSPESEGTEAKIEMVTEPFEARFLGTYTYAGPDTLPMPKCTDTLSTWRAIVDCQGTVNIFGDMTVHFDFCGNEKGYYGNTSAYMLDSENDTLFITCTGQVIQGKTEEHPAYVVSYWKDDFEILGGTGKFAGATGNGKTDDYNSSEDSSSHHHWTGSITYQKQIPRPD